MSLIFYLKVLVLMLAYPERKKGQGRSGLEESRGRGRYPRALPESLKSPSQHLIFFFSSIFSPRS